MRSVMPGAAALIAARSCRNAVRAFGGVAARYSETVVAVFMAGGSSQFGNSGPHVRRRSVVFCPMRTALFALIFSSVALAQEPLPIRGFTAGSAAAERELEQRFRAIPSPDNLREYMRTITAEPHHAGSPNSKKVAEYVLGEVQVVGARREHRGVRGADAVPDRAGRGAGRPGPATSRSCRSRRSTPIPTPRTRGSFRRFNAYSADGDVTADLVYVNYGIPEDYEQLAKLGIDVKGKIVIARYGRSWRGIKPKVAWEHGAVGCIIYSDPKTTATSRRRVPDRAFRPEQGVQRGSVMDMPVYPGDPLTPGLGVRARQQEALA